MQCKASNYHCVNIDITIFPCGDVASNKALPKWRPIPQVHFILLFMDDIYFHKPLANLLSSKTISTHNQRGGLSFFMKALFHRKRNVGPGVNRRYFYVSLSVLQDELSHEVKPGWPSTCRGLDENRMSSTHTGERMTIGNL